MSLEIVRRVRGNVHGTIDMSALEDAVISHEFVQRLRRIKQTAFLSYVFPGATHTRFEHSLGVMHLAGLAWQKLQANQRRFAELTSKFPDFSVLETRGGPAKKHGFLAATFSVMNPVFDSDYHLQVLRLAGLLHDIGHPPYSHSGERFLPSWKEIIDQNKDAPAYLRAYFETAAEDLRAKGKDPSKTSVRHEVFSLMLIDRLLADVYREYPNLKLKVDSRDIISVICPKIIPDQNSPLKNYGVHKLLHELISGELDIDRMDYLLRDSRECGVVYGIFDVERILDGLCMYLDGDDKCLHVAINSTSLAAFEDYLRARHSLYLQVYFHKTSLATEAMLQQIKKRLPTWSLPARAAEFAAVDEYNVVNHMMAAAAKYFSDPYESNDFARLVKNLFFNRRLWKMVFESLGESDDQLGPNLERVQKIIAEEGLTYEVVSSSSTLTRFLPRGEGEASKNYLRLIRKDPFGIPRVVPIEDYAAVISANQTTRIARVYVEDCKDQSGVYLHDRIRAKINAKQSEFF